MMELTEHPLYQACLKFMEEDLRRSGLDCDSSPVLPHPTNKDLKEGRIDAAYIIPYPDRMGKPTPMYRVRNSLTDRTPSTINKYTQPSRKQIGDAALLPYFPITREPNDSGEYWIAEGEKKILAAIHHWGVYGSAIGGCYNYRGPRGEQIHPELLEDIREYGARRVVIVPDGDWRRPDIGAAYGTLAHTLRRVLRVDVVLLDLMGQPQEKLDDYIAAGGARAALREVDETLTVYTPEELGKVYGVRCRLGATGKPISVVENEENLDIIFRALPEFGPYEWEERLGVLLHDGKSCNGDLEMHKVAVKLQSRYSMHNMSPGRAITALLAVVQQHRRRNLIREYLDSLQWDGKDRFETLLEKMDVRSDRKRAREALMKWLYMLAKRVREPGCMADWMIVLYGPQGGGKTSWPSWMFGQKNVVTITGGDDRDKDFQMKIHAGLIINIDEMASFTSSKAQLEQTKSMMSNREDTFRPPYARDNKTFERSSVFYGSTNDEFFLKDDPSGYRRFVVIEVGMMDREWIIFNREQLIAQAMEADFEDSYNYVEGSLTEAAKYVLEDVFENILYGKLASGTIAHVERHHNKHGRIWTISMAQVLQAVDQGDGPAVQKRLSTALRKAGYDTHQFKVDGYPQRLWYTRTEPVKGKF